jgi:hypothetical protein
MVIMNSSMDLNETELNKYFLYTKLIMFYTTDMSFIHICLVVHFYLCF